MRRRSLLNLIILNMVVTFVVVAVILLVIWPAWQNLTIGPTRTAPLSPPLIVVVTATLDPRATQAVMIVTATPPAAAPPIGGTPNADQMTATVLARLGLVPTLDPALLPPRLGTASANTTDQNGTPALAATDANGCQTYTIQKGDFAGKIADSFGVSVADLMKANQLSETDLTRLQIGQVLIIPLNGCGLATEIPSPTPTKFVVPSLPATVTLAPTAAHSQVEIVQVISPGDITAEGVLLHNVSGGMIPMTGWKLTDGSGHAFTFPDFRMFAGGQVTINTRAGTSTPIVLYWGLPRAVWGEPGIEIQLLDDKGNVQATHSVTATDKTAQPLDPGASTPAGTGL